MQTRVHRRREGAGIPPFFFIRYARLARTQLIMFEWFREAISFGKELKTECGKAADVVANDVRSKATRQKTLAVPMRMAQAGWLLTPRDASTHSPPHDRQRQTLWFY